jgi:caffeoyl-CoA O-methyltransferase
MDFIDSNIVKYAEDHTSEEPSYLYQLNRYTHSNLLKPRMLSGHLQGRFLALMSQLIKPDFILDIGTYTGYSALCLAEGLSNNGRLYTIDHNDEVLAVAKDFFTKANMSDKITALHGNAIELIEQLNSQVPYWNIVWMDAEKADYINYYNLCIDKIAPGGLIMADNVLWSGKIIEQKELEKDKDTILLNEFNTMVQNDQRVENILMPIRDGIMMIRKI